MGGREQHRWGRLERRPQPGPPVAADEQDIGQRERSDEEGERDREDGERAGERTAAQPSRAGPRAGRAGQPQGEHADRADRLDRVGLELRAQVHDRARDAEQRPRRERRRATREAAGQCVCSGGEQRQRDQLREPKHPGVPAKHLGGTSGQHRPAQRCRRVREADLGPEVPDRHAEVVGPPELVVPERPQCSVPHCDLDTGNQRDEQDDARGVDQASSQADPQAKVPAGGGRRARVQGRGGQHDGSTRHRHATFESMSHRPRAAQACGGARRGR